MGMTRKKTKNPPYFSHEFVIQNHADILACFAILIVLGLVSEKTASTSKLFVFLQYGLKNESSTEVEASTFSSSFERGILDVFTVLFAAIMLAVFHGVVQEYIIDKISRKLHLSKTKNGKFNESSQLTVWWVLSTFWGFFEIFQSAFVPHIAFLWEGYPHTSLEWSTKLYFICQIGYWLHMFPELYFQKVKKEELLSRTQYYSLHFVFIVGAYMLHFWRICLVLLTLHSVVEAVFNISRILQYADKTEYATCGFTTWQWIFPAVRFISLTFSFLTFLFGLNSITNQGVDFPTGCYNSVFIRLVCLVAMCVLQGWLMWKFIHFQAEKSREEAEIKRKLAEAEAVKTRVSKKSQKRSDNDEQSSSVSTREKVKLKKN